MFISKVENAGNVGSFFSAMPLRSNMIDLANCMNESDGWRSARDSYFVGRIALNQWTNLVQVAFVFHVEKVENIDLGYFLLSVEHRQKFKRARPSTNPLDVYSHGRKRGLNVCEPRRSYEMGMG